MTKSNLYTVHLTSRCVAMTLYPIPNKEKIIIIYERQVVRPEGFINGKLECTFDNIAEAINWLYE